MKNRASDIRRHRFTGKERLFFDTSIWLSLYGPQSSPPDHRTHIYSRALKQILVARVPLHLDAVVISEFVNRYARLRHQQSSTTDDYKTFRNSPAFGPIAADISADTSAILNDATPLDTAFSQTDLPAMLKEFGAGGTDFNDLLIADSCRRHSLTLVTHDGDFVEGGLSILTANNRLLIDCPP